MNHAEQLEATRKRAADESFRLLAEPLADVLAILETEGKISRETGAYIMTQFFKNFAARIAKRDEEKKRNMRP